MASLERNCELVAKALIESLGPSYPVYYHDEDQAAAKDTITLKAVSSNLNEDGPRAHSVTLRAQFASSMLAPDAADAVSQKILAAFYGPDVESVSIPSNDLEVLVIEREGFSIDRSDTKKLRVRTVSVPLIAGLSDTTSPEPTGFSYFRPGGVFTYHRPDGTSVYLRP